MGKVSSSKPKKKDSFQFQQFTVRQDQCAMKVGTDGVLLGAWSPVGEAKHILDIGAGTGLIALMLAQRSAQAQVTAVEVDPAAATQAKGNVDASPFADRIAVNHSSIQDFSLATDQRFDLIVSNPPFFSGGVLSEQEGRASVRHTTKLSHQDLLRAVQRLLSADGSFCLVLPWLEGLRFQEWAATYQLYAHQVVKVKPSPDKSPNRLLLQLKKTPPAGEGPETKEIAIYERSGPDSARSDAFQAMTASFYL